MRLYTAAQLAQMLGMSYNGIKYYRDRYQLGIRAGRQTIYTQEDIDAIRRRQQATTYRVPSRD